MRGTHPRETRGVGPPVPSAETDPGTTAGGAEPLCPPGAPVRALSTGNRDRCTQTTAVTDATRMVGKEPLGTFGTGKGSLWHVLRQIVTEELSSSLEGNSVLSHKS